MCSPGSWSSSGSSCRSPSSSRGRQRRTAPWLCCIAGWIVCMQLLDMYVIVLPALHGTGVHLSILDFLPLIGIGGTLAFFYLWIIGKTSLFPVRDPRSDRIAPPDQLAVPNDDETLAHPEQPRFLLSAWLWAVVLLFFSARSSRSLSARCSVARPTKTNGRKSALRSSRLRRKNGTRPRAAMGGSIKKKGVARIPIQRAMELELADLQSKKPAPAGPIATPHLPKRLRHPTARRNRQLRPTLRPLRLPRQFSIDSSACLAGGGPDPASRWHASACGREKISADLAESTKAVINELDGFFCQIEALRRERECHLR